MTIKQNNKAYGGTPQDTAAQHGAAAEELYKPKAGPGQVIKREMIAEVGKGNATVKRYRNVGASPLMLAHHRDQLACDAERLWRKDPVHKRPPTIMAADRLDCGQKFEKWWYNKLASPSRDSTMQSVSGGGQRSLTEVQEHADRQLVNLRNRMSSRNYLIVEAFCGDGHSMKDALRIAGIETNRDGTAYRVREALDELVCVLTGRHQVPMLVPVDR